MQLSNIHLLEIPLLLELSNAMKQKLIKTNSAPNATWPPTSEFRKKSPNTARGMVRPIPIVARSGVVFSKATKNK